jgi:hypothetical protein
LWWNVTFSLALVGGAAVARADEVGLVVVAEVAPGDGDEAGAERHVDRAVVVLDPPAEEDAGRLVGPVAVAEGAVVDPDVGRAGDADEVVLGVPLALRPVGRVPLREQVERVLEGDVADDDVVDVLHREGAADDPGVAAEADDGLVRADVDDGLARLLLLGALAGLSSGPSTSFSRPQVAGS